MKGGEEMILTAVIVLLLALGLVAAILLGQEDLVGTLYACIGDVIGIENGVA
jgi:hypothetical protein